MSRPVPPAASSVPQYRRTACEKHLLVARLQAAASS